MVLHEGDAVSVVRLDLGELVAIVEADTVGDELNDARPLVTLEVARVAEDLPRFIRGAVIAAILSWWSGSLRADDLTIHTHAQGWSSRIKHQSA